MRKTLHLHVRGPHVGNGSASIALEVSRVGAAQSSISRSSSTRPSSSSSSSTSAAGGAGSACIAEAAATGVGQYKIKLAG